MFRRRVPIRFKFFGVEVETEISSEMANKIACGLAGVAAGTAVMAVGFAVGNGEVIKAGGAIAVASVVGTAAAMGLEQGPEEIAAS